MLGFVPCEGENTRATLGQAAMSDPQHSDTEDPAVPRKLVCFFLHGQELGADIDDVKETMVVRPITRVFLTPSWVCGIINLRGDVVAVLDLAQLLGLPPTVVTDSSRIVVVQHGGRSAGVLVDGLAEVRTLDDSQLEPPPVTLSPESGGLLRGVITVEDGKPLQVLDLKKLFESDRLRAFRREAREA